MGLCNIDFNDDVYNNVYAYAYRSLEETIEAGETFDFDKIARRLFDAVNNKAKNPMDAAAYVQILPYLLNQAVSDNKALRAKGFSADAMLDQSDKFDDLQAAINHFTVKTTKAEVQLSKDSLAAAKKDGIDVEEPVDNFVDITSNVREQAQKELGQEMAQFQHKKSGTLSSTGQQSLSGWDGFYVDILDPRVEFIYNFLDKFQENLTGDASTMTLGGHTGFGLTAISKSNIKDGKLNGRTIVHQRDLDVLAGNKETTNVQKKLTESDVDTWKAWQYERYNANKEMIKEGVDPRRFQYPPSEAAIEKKYKQLKSQIGKTAWIVKPLSNKEYNKAVELFVTDNDGKMLFFDEEYNVVDNSQGMPIYFPMAGVKKTKSGYTYVKGGNKKGVMTPEELAKFENKDEWADMSKEVQEDAIKQAEETQQRELKLMYQMQEAVKNNKNALVNAKITGVKIGVSSVVFSKFTKPSSQVDFPASGLAASQVVHVAERHNPLRAEVAGAAYFRLPGYGVSTMLEARNRTQAEAEALADLLLNDELFIMDSVRGKIPVPTETKLELFKNQVFTSVDGKGIQVFAQGTKGGLKILGKENKPVTDRQSIIDILTEPHSKEALAQYGAERVFNTRTGKINMPAYNSKDTGKVIRHFTIENNQVKTNKIDPLAYILDNTQTHVKLNTDNVIPKLNGYFTFELSDAEAEALAAKEEKVEKPKAAPKNKKVNDIKEDLGKGEQESLEDLEQELDEVVKKLKTLEEATDVPKLAEKAVKVTTQLAINFGPTVKEQVEDQVTEKELRDVAKEQGVTEEEAVDILAEEVEKVLENGDDAKADTKKTSVLSKVARRIVRVVRNLMILAALYTGTTAFSPKEGTYNLNNIVNTTADLISATPASEYSDTFILGMTKLGVYDPSVNEAILDSDSVKKIQELEEIQIKEDAAVAEIEAAHTKYKKENTYFEEIEKVQDSHRMARKGDSLLSARNQWFNEDGFTYKTGAIQSRMADGEVINKVKGVAHFMILDDLAIGLSTKTTDQELIDASKDFKKNRIGKDIKVTDYVPVFVRDSNDVNVKYKIASELDSSDITITRLHQFKFSDIDFNSKTSGRPFGFYGGGVYALEDKSGNGLSSFLFTRSGKDAYSRFSGGSYVLLFKDKQGNEVVHEISGSINMLRNEAQSIAKTFGIPETDIILGVYDAGSYSAKPSANTEGVLDTDQYRNYNKKHAHSGGALLYPDIEDQPTKEPISPDPFTGGMLLLSPLALIRRKEEEGEPITNEDIQSLKEYRDDLQAKINKIKAESSVAENPAETYTQEDIDNAFGDLTLDKPIKRRFRFEKLSPVHRKKAKISAKAYNKSPLSKLFPVTNAMHVVNSNAYATWTKNGITLHNGASHTDLYHEAWHGFSQFFLTVPEKAALYDEVAETAPGKKAIGEYAKANARTVASISKAEQQWVMEELIAEDYRKYRLSNGKTVKKGRTVRNGIFRKIYNFLKKMYQGLTMSRPSDLASIPSVKKLYEDLRIMEEEDLITYSPSELNVMPGWRQLNKGIIPFASNSVVKSNYADDNLISESIDSIMSSEVMRQIDIHGPEFAGALYTQPENVLPLLYGRVFTIMQERLDSLETEIAETEDITEATKLKTQQKIIQFAIDQAGTKKDWIDAMTNESTDGVVAYHLKKSKFLAYVPKDLSREALEDSFDIDGPIENTFSKGKNEFSIRDLAGSQIKTLLHGAKQYDSKGNVETNRLGFEKMMDFGKVFSTIVTLTKGIDDPSVMREKMLAASVHLPNKWIYNDILKKLGPVNTFARSSFSLWTNFWQAFYKADIPLDQLSVVEVFQKEESGQRARVVKVTFGRPQAVFRQAEYAFSNNFKTVKDNKFIKPNHNGENTLDVDALKKKYVSDVANRELEFLNDIGIEISDDVKVIKEISELVNLNQIFDKLVSVHDDLGIEITDVMYAIRKDFTEDQSTSNLAPSQDFAFGATSKPKTKKKLHIESEGTNLNTILDAHTRYSGEYPNVSVKNPKGNAVYEETQNSSVTRKLQAIEKSESFDELIRMPIMQHLDPRRNSFVDNAPIWLTSLYHMDRAGRPKRDGAKLEISNAAGTQLITEGSANHDFSTVTAQADKYTRIMQDMYSLLLGGRAAIMTPADKGTVTSLHLNNIIVESDLDKESKHLYIDTADFMRVGVGETKALKIMQGHIQAEIDRIHRIEKGLEENVRGYTTDILYTKEDTIPKGKKIGDVKQKARGKEFQVFHGMFLEETKKKFLALETPLAEYLLNDTTEANELRAQMMEEFEGFLESEVETIRDRVGNMLFFDQTIMANLSAMMEKKGYDLNDAKREEISNIDERVANGEINKDQAKIAKGRLQAAINLRKENALIKSYALNLFIHNTESLGIIYGDLAMYKDFFKRNPGINSDGYQFRNDVHARNYINERMFTPDSEHFKPTYRSTNFPELLPRKYDGTLNTAIFRETVLRSAMINDYKVAFEKHFTNLYSKEAYDNESERTEAIDNAVYVALKPYTEMEEGDAQGWLTFDAYKMLGELEGKWTDAQDKLYNKIIAGKQLTLNEVSEYFPVRKYQYWGLLKTDGVPIYAFHKYSLMPLIPNVIAGMNMQTMHDNMIKQNIDYGVHETGSKIGSIYKEGAVEGDKMWEDLDSRTLAEVPAYDGTEATQVYTPNVIFVEYLKDQLDINSQYKGKGIFPTQFRKLIELGTIANGIPVDFMPKEKSLESRKAKWNGLSPLEKLDPNNSKLWAKFVRYENNLAENVKRRKIELLEKAGWTMDEFKNGTGNMQSLIELIRNELERQDVGDHELAFVETDFSGTKILHDLSMSPSAEKIERALTSFVNNTVIRQKVNGEPLVQMASTMSEPRNATVDEKAKWKQEGLLSYRVDPITGITLGAEVKIALQGDFKKLLYMKHSDGDIIAVKDDQGKVIEDESIQRLNETINDPKWRTVDNLRMITLVGVRIPVQGYNSMEFFHVKEFLPEAAGNIIIPPSEIVAKSGSDFDIDKLTMMMPKLINVNGKVKLLKNSKSTKSKEMLKDQIKATRDQRQDVLDVYRAPFKKLSKGLGSEFNKELNAKYYPQIDALKEDLVKVRREYGKTHQLIMSGVKTNQLINKTRRLEKSWAEIDAKINELEDNLLNERGIVGQQIKENPEMVKLFDERNVKLDNLNQKEGELSEELQGLTSAATENEIMDSMYDFLSDPINFINLIMPNDVTLVKGKADQMRKRLAKMPGRYNPEMGWKKIKGGDVEDLGKVSPTRILTAVHNNYIHEGNSVGKAALGQGAVDNTFNALLNRVGAHLNPYYGIKVPSTEVKGKTVPLFSSVMAAKNELLSRKASLQKALDKKNIEAKKETRLRSDLQFVLDELAKERRIEMFLPVNKMKYEGADVISLSHMYDTEGKNNIAEIISQLMNGWMDVAKDQWVFDVQGNKIVAPVLLLLVQAGVPFNLTVDFLSNPIIMEYVEEQLKVLSPISALHPKNALRAESVLKARTRAKSNMLKRYGSKFLNDGKKLKTNKAFVYGITQKLVNAKTAPALFSSENLEAVSKGEKQDDAFKLFLHYLELEEVGKGMRDMKMTLNYDTSKSTTLFDAAKSIADYDELLDDTIFPRHIIEKVAKETPIGSFQIQEFIMELWGGLFPLRNHPSLNTFIINKLKDMTSLEEMKGLFGTDEKFISAFRNDLLVYSFLNEFTNFDINNLDVYKGLDVTLLKGSIKDAGILKRGVGVVRAETDTETNEPFIFIDKETLDIQFKLDSYSDNYQAAEGYMAKYVQSENSYAKLKLSTVPIEAFHSEHGPHKEEYFRFVIERELLRFNNPIEDLMKTQEFSWKYSDRYEAEDVEVVMETYEEDGMEITQHREETEEERKKRVLRMSYEDWLRDAALDNILNFWKLFKSDSTVAHKLLDIKNMHGHLEIKYAAVDDLVVDEGSGFKSVKLKDNRMDGDMINGYHQNMLDLMDKSEMKVIGDTPMHKIENDRISNFFEMMPVYSFLQSGVNATDRLSLTRIMPYEKLSALLEGATKNTIQVLNNPETLYDFLEKYYHSFRTHNENESARRRTRDLRSVGDVSAVNIRPGLETTYRDGVFNVNMPESKEEFMAIVNSNPDVMFVVERAEDVDSLFYVEGIGAVPMTDNMVSITTRKLATDGDNAKFSDAEYSVNRDRILKEIQKITDIQDPTKANGKLAFVNSGYGRYMLLPASTQEGTGFKAVRTYQMISKALYEGFDFLNKESRYLPDVRRSSEISQDVTDKMFDDSINSQLDDVLAKIDKC